LKAQFDAGRRGIFLGLSSITLRLASWVRADGGTLCRGCPFCP